MPEVLRRWTLLLWLVVIIDAALTPLLVPFVGLAFYRDQKKVKRYFLLVRRNPDFSKTPDICTNSASNLHSISRIFNIQESRKTPFLATSTPSSCKVF